MAIFDQVTDSQIHELYFEEIFENGFSSGPDPLFDLRNYFYPESSDPHIMDLSNAGCVAEVLDTVAQMDQPSPQHLTQVMKTTLCT